MIGQGISQPWPSAVLAAINQFKQGNLIERPPIFYAAIAAHAIHDQTKRLEDPSLNGNIVLFEPPYSLAYGLITTQTCEICEESQTPKHPWIHVVPVYAVDTAALAPGQQGQIENNRIGHLVRLTGATLPSGLWVADLRIEVPLEKSWVVGHQPIEAFSSESEYYVLAKRLAGRRDRPALAPAISNHIVKSLRKLLESGKGSAARNATRELRLLVSPSRLAPAAAQLLVLSDDPLPAEARTIFSGWRTMVKPVVQKEGVALLPNRYRMLRKLSAEVYIESVSLDFSYLSPDT